MKYTLKDICTKIGSGATPTGGKEAYKGGDYALVRSQNVLDYTFTTSGLAYINEIQAKKLDGVKVEVGDILLNITGDSVARACIIPDEILPARVNQHVAIIRANNQYALNEYLLYFLQYNKQYLLSISQGGGTRSAITKKMIEDIEIDLPSLEDQLSIVNIINSISKKIEVNQQINDNLEQQAQALYESWFVDFEPFKDGNFVESELGLIPEGWEVRDIYKYSDVIYGAPYKSSLFNENKEGYPLIRIRDLKSFAPQFYTQEILPQTEYIVAGDVIAGMDAEFTPYIWQGEKGVLNQRCCKFKGQYPWISNYYLLNLLKPELEYVQSYKTGTTVSHLGKADIDRFNVITPPESIVKAFSFIVNSLLEQKVKCANEIRSLSNTRDILLPKLMSGEIKINEIDC